ncbi:host cell factor C1 regulator 1 isoform X2 [Nycticebus coucang]|uniref:host cell factor C1 regulator 1 isoform X2 n=1 Tax=Nycticebus coucang TaxID=9470 RepID=UPI00234E1584|nr:host cell factor C1 regulator 1 isoform X2 [Nycticebus coucang]
MILLQPSERDPQGRAQCPSQATLGVTRGLDARETLHKQFISEENMATHFSRLSLHNDHPYCTPSLAFPPALPPLSSLERAGNPRASENLDLVGGHSARPASALCPVTSSSRSPCSELLVWRYPGSLIPEALRLLRLGDTTMPHYSAAPAGDTVEL